MDQGALFRKVAFADSTFERIECDYDEVRLFLTDSSGREVRLRGVAHVGISWVGHWDESVIEHAELLDSDPAITHALERVRAVNGQEPGLGGGLRDFRGPWQLLRLSFIDGVCIELVAQRFEVA